jgi:CRP/FNR family cyclic AMP-dependent transcriptional regulator
MSAAATKPTDHDVLAKLPLFAGLEPSDRATLAGLLRTREYKAQEPVFFVGEPGDDMFFIQRGQVVISYPDDNGVEVTLATLGPGQFFGEISLLDGGPRTATARAVGDTTLLSLDCRGFYGFLSRHPSAAVHMVKVLGQRQRDAVAKLRGIRNANEAIAERQTPWQRLAARIAAFGASGLFVGANVLLFILWISVNEFRSRAYDPQHPPKFFDEPPTFFTLGFIITLEAILLSMFVLNSQKQQAERDGIRADLDYQVNLKAHSEVMQLHQKIDRLEARLTALTETAEKSE